jgi:PAS domain-containing protein
MSAELITQIIAGISILGNIVVGIDWYQGRKLKTEEKETDSNISVNLNASNREDFNSIISALSTDSQILREDLARYKQEMSEIRLAEQECADRNLILEKRVNKLFSDFRILQLASPKLPTPAWMKDEAGVMVSLNDEYEALYLKPIDKTREDYIGKTDTEFWGKEIGEIYRRNDLKVMHDKSPIASIEPIQTKDGVKEVYVLKYPLLVGEDYVVGIGGHTIAEEYINYFIKVYNDKHGI